MKYKKLYVTKNCEHHVTGVFTDLQSIIDAYHYVDLDLFSLEQIEFTKEPTEIYWDIFVSLVEVNPIFE